MELILNKIDVSEARCRNCGNKFFDFSKKSVDNQNISATIMVKCRRCNAENIVFL